MAPASAAGSLAVSLKAEIVVAGDEGFAVRASREITQRLRSALAERPVVNLALAGGSTPRPVYRALTASPGGLGSHEWQRVHFFWSDERCVPAGDPRRNVVAATDDLLSVLDLPAANIHAPRSEGDPLALAASYELEIRRTLGAGAVEIPRFDLVLLGVGADGHTASLFPRQFAEPKSAHGSSHSLVVATRSPKAPHERISFSYELLSEARAVVILASGENKAAVVRRALEEGDRSLPVTRVGLDSGVCWLLDAAASRELSER